MRDNGGSPTHPTTAMTSPAPNAMFRKPLPGTSLDYFDTQAAVEAIQHGARPTQPNNPSMHAEKIELKADPDINTD